ncbi:MAG: hypothetical protein JRJ23_03100 [Deltaproteobacteria bacterium]|nr:hypothetical protein [Deltaproteobacteria bacterium]
MSKHLTYLKKPSSLFETEEDKKMGQTNLICADCGHPVTKVSEKIDIFARHDHSFTNLGYLVELGCYRNAPGCIGIQRISNGYSWFRGYSWQIQLCQECFSQLGWKYMNDNESFYGLIFNMLKEDKPEETDDN